MAFCQGQSACCWKAKGLIYSAGAESPDVAAPWASAVTLPVTLRQNPALVGSHSSTCSSNEAPKSKAATLGAGQDPKEPSRERCPNHTSWPKALPEVKTAL